jgi:hypothetical protein
MFRPPVKLDGVDYLKIYKIFWRCHCIVSNKLGSSGAEDPKYKEEFGYLFSDVNHSLICCVIFGDIQIDSEIGKSFKNYLHENSVTELVNEIVLNPATIVPKMVEVFNERFKVCENMFNITSSLEDSHFYASKEMIEIEGYIKNLQSLIQG